MTMQNIYYFPTTFQTKSTQAQTHSSDWTLIDEGLQMVLPRASADFDYSLVTLNIPNPYATGSDAPCGYFGISVMDNMGKYIVQPPFACFSYQSDAPQRFGRCPTTLVIEVKLNRIDRTSIRGVWKSMRGSTVIIDSPASLSAILGFKGDSVQSG
jgi:hypothetical protein